MTVDDVSSCSLNLSACSVCSEDSETSFREEIATDPIREDPVEVFSSMYKILGCHELINSITNLAREFLKRIEELAKEIHFSVDDAFVIESGRLFELLLTDDDQYETCQDIDRIKDCISRLFIELHHLVSHVENKLRTELDRYKFRTSIREVLQFKKDFLNLKERYLNILDRNTMKDGQFLMRDLKS